MNKKTGATIALRQIARPGGGLGCAGNRFHAHRVNAAVAQRFQRQAKKPKIFFPARCSRLDTQMTGGKPYRNSI